eukprot:Hpha_TRINITY_DN11831_c0_g1::TRINITY_DN11831_c0_g1_i2::g.2131::m.2131/K10737/MCM8; DNA helicase MCM8
MCAGPCTSPESFLLRPKIAGVDGRNGCNSSVQTGLKSNAQWCRGSPPPRTRPRPATRPWSSFAADWRGLLLGVVRVTQQLRNQDVPVGGPDAPPTQVVLLDARSVHVTQGGMPLPPSQQRETELRALVAANRSSMFHIVCNSLCSQVIGHENVKAAVSLALFGCSPRANAGVQYPGQLSVLIVGDRSVGKSSILRAAAAVSPRGALLDGGDSQQMRLLAPQNANVQASAHATAAGGVLCIDEVGACPDWHGALVELLLQETTAPTATDVPALVATVSPPSGVYNQGVNIAENVPPKFSRLLLQSFDMVCLMLDHRDETSDHQLSAMLLDMYNAGVEGAKQRLPNATAVPVPAHALDTRQPLLSRLKLPLTARGGLDGEYDALPPNLLRQLISLGSRYSPVLTPAAKHALMRCCAAALSREGTEEFQRSGRQLALSLLRLAEARARVELSPEITEQHALDAVELAVEARADLGPQGRPGGKAARRAGKPAKGARGLFQFLEDLCETEGRDSFSSEELHARCAPQARALEIDLNAALLKLNQESLVIKTPSGMWRILKQ